MNNEKYKTARILITGATGSVGTELSKLFAARKVPFRAMVRSIKKAHALGASEGAELVAGDFNEAESVAAALKGAERAFLLTNSSEHAESQQAAFVDAAGRAGVKHIVKLSQWAADAKSPVRFLRYRAACVRRSATGVSRLPTAVRLSNGCGYRPATVPRGS
jgi:uncharacterized protein YbjT (DUF2867 family)